jgi:tight adherence protein C
MIYAVPIVLALLAAAAIFSIAFAVMPTTNPLAARLRKLESVNDGSIEKVSPIIDRLVSSERKSSMRRLLNEGGMYDRTPLALAQRTLGALAIGIAAGALLIFFMHDNVLAVFAGVMYPLLRWSVPYVRLLRTVRLRKASIARELPDFIDMLATTVQAGLSLNAAMIQATHATTGSLKEELTVLLAEVRLGRPLADSLNAMSERVNETSLTATVSSIVQAENLGSSLTDVLQEVANDSRERRWLRAEEQAAQLPVKMLIPMGLFMIPSLYLMIFGPVLAQLLRAK